MSSLTALARNEECEYLIENWESLLQFYEIAGFISIKKGTAGPLHYEFLYTGRYHRTEFDPSCISDRNMFEDITTPWRGQIPAIFLVTYSFTMR